MRKRTYKYQEPRLNIKRDKHEGYNLFYGPDYVTWFKLRKEAEDAKRFLEGRK